MALYQETIASYDQEYQLNKSRYEKGLVNLIDVSNAALQLSNAKADYEDIRRQRTLQEDLIAVLIGEIPSEVLSRADASYGFTSNYPSGNTDIGTF